MTKHNNCLGTRAILIQSQDGALSSGTLVLYTCPPTGLHHQHSVSRPVRSRTISDNKEDVGLGTDMKYPMDKDEAVSHQSTFKNRDSIIISSSSIVDTDERNSGVDEPLLNIMLTDGNATFMTSVDLSELKMTQEQLQHRDPTCWFVDVILLQSTGEEGRCDTNLSYCEKYQTIDEDANNTARPIFSVIDNDCIRLDVKYRFQTIVRVVLSVEIPRISSSPLPIVSQLSDFLSESLSTLQTLQGKVEELEKERNGWKDTAQKLCVEHWHCEREELMKRFLVLLNKVKGDVRIANEKLIEEQQRYKVLLEQYKRQQQFIKRHGGEGDVAIDYEDEHDDVNLPEDEVERLARGIRVDGSTLSHTEEQQVASNKRKLATNEENSTNNVKYLKNGGGGDDDVCWKDSKPAATSSANTNNSRSNKYTRKNPLTGSIEIWNVEDMFSDTSEE
jgi:hypothetical protein